MSTSEPIRIPVGSTILDGDLVIPAAARGLVLFAHGSGSSRHSSRNRYVAEVLQEAGFATLLMDLLTRGEEAVDLRTAELRFDIPLLSRRLVGAADWLFEQRETRELKIGTFGASTGAAAALIAAAERPRRSRRWCRAEDVPTSPPMRCLSCRRPRCSSSAVSTCR